MTLDKHIGASDKAEVTNAMENMADLASLCYDAVTGNPFALAQIMTKVAGTCFLIPNALFVTKLTGFLNGVELSEKDREKMRKKLGPDGSSEYAHRLVELINQCESERKVKYLSNATRALIDDCIDRQLYFRVCNVVTQLIEEDLVFLRDHVLEGDRTYPYSIEVQSLASMGLMLQRARADASLDYTFTSLAKQVDQYTVSFGDNERYPDLR